MYVLVIFRVVSQAEYETYLKRFTVDMDTWTLVEIKEIMQDLPLPVEFPVINYAYSGLKYKFSYMIRGAFIRNNAVIKVRI